MRFALTCTMMDPKHRSSYPDMLDQLREQAMLADELGFETFWMAEHHFGPYGMGNSPNPILVGADLAVRTRNIRLGQLANIAVWWHPIRLAEDIAVLDNLTRGRIDVGFGRGIWAYEGPQFHPHADPRKGKENQELFRETVEIVRRALTEDFFSHEGSNYTFPARDTEFAHPKFASDPRWQDGSRVMKLNVTPRTYQQPHPPFWMTVSTDASVTTAAELGLIACYWQPPPRRLRQRFELYAEIRSKREGRPYRVGEAQAVMRHGYVASSMEEARRIAEPGVLFNFTYNDPYRGLQVFMNPGEEVRRDMKIDWDFLLERQLLVGSPEDVAEKIHELEEVCGLEYLIMNYGNGWVSHQEAMRSLELFGTKVMPRFKDTQR